MRSLERVNIRTNERTYVLTYIRTGQTLYPLHNFVVRGDNEHIAHIPYALFYTLIACTRCFKRWINIESI